MAALGGAIMDTVVRAEEGEMGKLKVLNGRAATEADSEAGSVVFYIPDSRSTPYRFDHELPLIARIINPGDGIAPHGSLVTIVQAEQGDNGEVVIGFMFGEGEEGVCTLQELEVIGPAPEEP
jgi:hypothetical protein